MPKSLIGFVDEEKRQEYRNYQRKRNYARGRKDVTNTFKRWDDNDIKLICKKPNGMTDRQLAEMLGRSVQAIQIKRARTIIIELIEQGKDE